MKTNKLQRITDNTTDTNTDTDTDTDTDTIIPNDIHAKPYTDTNKTYSSSESEKITLHFETI